MKQVVKGRMTWGFEEGNFVQLGPSEVPENYWTLMNIDPKFFGKFVKITIEEITKEEANVKED